MHSEQSLEAPQAWAYRHFGKSDLGDVRRVARVVKIAEAMVREPGATVPQLFEEPYAVKATYHFFNREEATPDRLQAGHRSLVRQRLSQAGTYLLLEDTTELSWMSYQPRTGLGLTGAHRERYQGVHLHSVLSVQWPDEWSEEPDSGQRPAVEIIGLCDQQYYIRQPRPHGEPKENSLARKNRQRESQLWEQATQRIGPKVDSADVRWVRVCDRGADIYEHLRACHEAGHGFVVRANQDRALVDEDMGHTGRHLFQAAREAPALGHFDLELRSREEQPARTVVLAVSATQVVLRSPQRPGHSPGRNPSLSCSVIRIWEREEQQISRVKKKETKALEWVLLCDREVGTYEDAHQCALQYATRWLIEEFHKALKTGLRVERLQLHTAERLFAAIAICSVVALRLLDLRERSRINPGQEAEAAGLEALQLQLLRLKAKHPVRTVRDVALALGRLGGHLNRRGDGMPGWQTLWRGLRQIQTLAEGVRLAKYLDHKFG